jgi:hypothetical protein
VLALGILGALDERSEWQGGEKGMFKRVRAALGVETPQAES